MSGRENSCSYNYGILADSHFLFSAAVNLRVISNLIRNYTKVNLFLMDGELLGSLYLRIRRNVLIKLNLKWLVWVRSLTSFFKRILLHSGEKIRL